MPTRADRFSRWTLVFAAVVVAIAAIVTGIRVITDDSVNEADLVPASVSNCITGVKASLALADNESAVDFSPEAIIEFGTLSDRCSEREILIELYQQIPYSLADLARLTGVPTPEVP